MTLEALKKIIEDIHDALYENDLAIAGEPGSEDYIPVDLSTYKIRSMSSINGNICILIIDEADPTVHIIYDNKTGLKFYNN